MVITPNSIPDDTGTGQRVTQNQILVSRESFYQIKSKACISSITEWYVLPK